MTSQSTQRSLDTSTPAVLTHPGRAVIVEGRAGIGKSTAMTSIQDQLIDRGFMVVNVTPGFDVATYRTGSGRPSAVPIGASGGGGGPTLAQLLINHAERRRLALVIDDLNELPASSAGHLRSLIHGMTDTINVVVSVRGERGASGSMARLIDDIHQLMRAETISLAPWTTGDLVAWSESELGRPLSWPTATAIRTWTEGTPGWATVWLRNLRHRDLLCLRGGVELRLTAGLDAAAQVMAGTIDRYLNPISTPRWAVMELVHRIDELRVDQIPHLAPATTHDASALSDTAGELLNTGLLTLDEHGNLGFANPLVGHLVARHFPARSHQLQQLLDALVASGTHRTDPRAARTLCRLALDRRLRIPSPELREAIGQVEPLDPELAGAATSRLADRSDDHGAPESIDGRHLMATIAQQVDTVPDILGAGRVDDGRQIIDAILADRPCGPVADRARSLRRLIDVMAGHPVPTDPDEPEAGGGAVDWCRAALLHLRNPTSAPEPPPPPRLDGPLAGLAPLVDLLGRHMNGDPGLLDHHDLPDDPLAQFAWFVEHGFADGAFLLVGLLGRKRPDGPTRERFLCLVATSWVDDQARNRLSSLLIDPFDQQIAALIAGGQTYAETASTLGIARHTVSNRLKVVYRALGVNSRTELQAMAAQVA